MSIYHYDRLYITFTDEPQGDIEKARTWKKDHKIVFLDEEDEPKWLESHKYQFIPLEKLLAYRKFTKNSPSISLRYEKRKMMNKNEGLLKDLLDVYNGLLVGKMMNNFNHISFEKWVEIYQILKRIMNEINPEMLEKKFEEQPPNENTYYYYIAYHMLNGTLTPCKEEELLGIYPYQL